MPCVMSATVMLIFAHYNLTADNPLSLDALPQALFMYLKILMFISNCNVKACVTMDPGSVAATAIGAAATTTATKGVDKMQERYGVRVYPQQALSSLPHWCYVLQSGQRAFKASLADYTACSALIAASAFCLLTLYIFAIVCNRR